MAEQEVQLQVQGTTVPGPGGVPMVALIFDFGFSAHKIVMSDEVADALAPRIAAILQEAAAGTRRQRLGLIIPGQAPVNLPLPPPTPNGRAG